MSHELFIREPSINAVPPHDRRYLFGSAIHGMLAEQMESQHILPDTHPRVLELFAGDGPVALWLSNRGWSDFTCIDQAVSPTPAAPEGTTWIYADLQELFHRLTHQEDIEQFTKMQHSFDIVTATFAIHKRYFILPMERNTIAKFFVREGGFIYTH